MSTTDPFPMPPRWRPWSLLGLGLASVGVFAMAGLLGPAEAAPRTMDVQATILEELDRLERAAREFTADTGAYPSPSFDLGEGSDGGLLGRGFVPLEALGGWRGPYLSAPLRRPTRSSFWGLAEPRSLYDQDGDGEADELWARLHRGHGEVDDETALWLDSVLDDGVPSSGCVRATPEFVWFKLLER